MSDLVIGGVILLLLVGIYLLGSLPALAGALLGIVLVVGVIEPLLDRYIGGNDS